MAGSPRFNRGIILAGEDGHVTISELVRVHACPVRFYYEKDEPVTESDRYAVCKQLSYHLGRPLEADAIWDEVLTVRPTTDPALREFMDICIAACTKHEWKPAAQTDVTVVSKKHGIAGMIDRVAEDGTFSIIRAAGAMPFGTYAADRLRVAGIAFCLEEMTGHEVEGGHVEYIPDGISRVPHGPAPGPAPAPLDPAQAPGNPPGRGARPPAQCSLQPVQV